MIDSFKFFMSLPPLMREGLKSLARTEGTSIDDLLVIAIAEKLARAEHAAWLAEQRWLHTMVADPETLGEKLKQLHAAHPAASGSLPPIEEKAVQRSDDSLLQLLHEDEERERKRLTDLFDGAPVFIAVLSGPDHVFEMVNQAYRELMGDRNFIGKRVVECVPEVAGTIWMDHLNRVYQTGAPWVEHGARLSIAPVKGQPLEHKFVDYTYKARRRPDGTTSGIIALGVDTSLVQEVLQSSGGATFLLNDKDAVTR